MHEESRLVVRARRNRRRLGRRLPPDAAGTPQPPSSRAFGWLVNPRWIGV